MSDIKKAQERILDISNRKKNVTAEEIVSVIALLKRCGYDTHIRSTDHSSVIRVNGQIFSICTHKTGSKQLRECYVKEFLKSMIALELYDEDR